MCARIAACFLSFWKMMDPNLTYLQSFLSTEVKQERRRKEDVVFSDLTTEEEARQREVLRCVLRSAEKVRHIRFFVEFVYKLSICDTFRLPRLDLDETL